MQIFFQGNVVHLEGKLPEVGQKAPNFELVANDLSVKTLDDYAGKTLVIATVPSIDTPICDLEARHFNEEAGKLSDKVDILVVSCDLPFAQSRWCGAAGAKNVTLLSDYKYNGFGKAYGVLIKELLLLARAIFVVNSDGIVTYVQVVPEITNAPDYGPVMDAIKKAL